VSSDSAAPHRPIRVLCLLWSGGLGGAERHVYDLALALPRDRFALTVCFFSRQGTYGPLLESHGISVHEMGLRGGADLRGILRYIRWLRRSDFDIVHDHLSTPWARAVTAWTRPDWAILSTEHTTLLLMGHGPAQRFWYRLNARYTSTTIAVSEAMRRALRQVVPRQAGRIVVLPNVVDSDRFPVRSDEDRETLARSLDLPVGARVLLSVGRLERDKGLDRILGLLLPVFRRHPDLVLLIAGEGSLRASLEHEAERSGLGGRVRLLGARRDVPELCDLCEIMVLASRFESFGIVAAEAMMAGRPVVGPRIPGLDEVVESGRTGTLLDPDRLETEFPAAVNHLLAHAEVRREMGRVGRQVAMDRFERRKVVARIARLYEDTAAGRPQAQPRAAGSGS
jgi:glycosyltransferase involved in cell wall biosynthesis